VKKSVCMRTTNVFNMETLGLCQHCSRPARNSCSLCGGLFCEEHFDKASGLCYNCALKVKSGDKRTVKDMDRLLH